MAFAVWIENRTPFAAATHVQPDADGQEVLVVLTAGAHEDHPAEGGRDAPGAATPTTSVQP